MWDINLELWYKNSKLQYKNVQFWEKSPNWIENEDLLLITQSQASRDVGDFLQKVIHCDRNFKSSKAYTGYKKTTPSFWWYIVVLRSETIGLCNEEIRCVSVNRFFWTVCFNELVQFTSSFT